MIEGPEHLLSAALKITNQQLNIINRQLIAGSWPRKMLRITRLVDLCRKKAQKAQRWGREEFPAELTERAEFFIISNSLRAQR